MAFRGPPTVIRTKIYKNPPIWHAFNASQSLPHKGREPRFYGDHVYSEGKREEGYALASRSLRSISPLLLRQNVYMHMSLYSKASKKTPEKTLAHLSTATDIESRLCQSNTPAKVRRVAKACLPLPTSDQILKAHDGSGQPIPTITSSRLAATCINFDGMLVPYRSPVPQACQHCRCCSHHSQQASHGTETAHTGKDHRLC